MAFDLATWKEELLITGRIVQDADDSVPPEEAHRRFLRYVELVDQLAGTEGPNALAALFQSIQVKDDYGAYQTTHGVMSRFPAEQFITILVQELPSLIRRQPDWAGDFLCGLANGRGGKWDYQIAMFNDAVAGAEPSVRQTIVNYIRSQEDDGWLDGCRERVLCAGVSEGSA